MKEFQAVFQMSKTVIFMVSYYTLGANTRPGFVTSAAQFCRNESRSRKHLEAIAGGGGMKNLYYLAFTAPDGKPLQGVFSSEERHVATFNPDTVTRYMTDLQPRTKDEAREMAVNVLYYDADTVNNGGNGLTWGEIVAIQNAIEKAARHFGLVREFRENGVI